MVSPTKVAAPCRFEETAIAITLGTGDIFSFFAMVTATGATIKTVATLSTKAEIIPANKAKDIMAHFTLGVFAIMISASFEGIFESINKPTTPMVPAIIMITFQSTEKKHITDR